MYHYTDQHDHDYDYDDDHVSINVLQDAGSISEAIAASDAASSVYDLAEADKTDTMMEVMTGGFSAGFAVHLLAEHLEKSKSDELGEIRERIEQKLNDGTLTDAKRQELDEFLRMLENNPEMLDARK